MAKRKTLKSRLSGEGLLKPPPERTLTYTSAKVVLVGESNVGKSYLAHRIATGKPPADGAINSTHGLRFWPLEPDRLDLEAVAPEGQHRNVVLWDMGGQDEYRLIHQLFLADTSVALVLLDPTRGATALKEAETWNNYLDKQLRGHPAVKLLVGTKQDQPSDTIDRRGLEQLLTECGFAGYYETSALTGRGVIEVCEAVAKAIDWNGLAQASRPQLFQRIRDEIEARRKQGEVILHVADLRHALSNQPPTEEEKRAVDAVTEQLATQGMIARSRVSTGEPVLVLQIHEIERYAGSLIFAARNNPRGVPALEVRAIGRADYSLPGIAGKDRLLRSQEKPVLECTVQLMLEHGICFQHEGLIIFPSLFAPAPEASGAALPHAVSLYYDFAGAIDNIYASLVAWLVLARDFGQVRLWSDRAEFEVRGGGLCGLRKMARVSGFAHLDVYFEVATPDHRRQEFISFVEDHLARHGVEIREHVAIRCVCGHQFAEETLRQRIARGDKDIVCPICETRHSLTEGAAEVRERDSRISQHTWALRTGIEKLREKVTEQAVQLLETAAAVKPDTGPIRLLHLSDLHFTATTPVPARLQWLLDDIKQDRGGLGFRDLDYLVISGDFTDRGAAEGFEKAYEFVSGLTQEFGLSAERCVFVPGNHDVVDPVDAYARRIDSVGLKEGEWIREGRIVLARDPLKYRLRFKPFSDGFFHKFLQRPYPADYAEQGMAIPFWETGIQFLTLNSCWQIDEFHRKRSSLQVEAVARAIKEAQKQETDARKSGQLAPDKPVLRIAVWHHSVARPEQMKGVEFLGNLEKNGVRIALHGDVHEMRRDFLGYRDRNLYLVGAGSFGARTEDRSEAAPRLYNILEIERNLSSMRVHTRCQPKPDGPWEGWNEWPASDGAKVRVPYYDLSFGASNQRTVHRQVKAETEKPSSGRISALVSSQEALTIPTQLIQAIRSGQCVLFAGGGISAAAGIPSLRDAIPEILKHALEQGTKFEKRLATALEAAQPFQALEVLSAHIERTKLLSLIRTIIAPTASPPSELSELLGSLGFSAVLTDRWDDVAAKAFSRRDPLVLLPQESQNISEMFGQDRFFILKLYGDLNRSDTVPLSQNDYQQMIADNSAFAQFVASVFASKTILFLGCRSDSIEQLLLSHRIVAGSRSRRHFALVPSSVDLMLQRERFRQSYGIDLMGFTVTPDYMQVLDFVRSLRAASGDLPRMDYAHESYAITSVVLNNIGPFEHLSLDLGPSFNIFLGNNGSGKSSVMRAIGLALCSHHEGLEKAAGKLLRSNASSGFVELAIGGSIFRTDLTRDGSKVRLRPQQLTPIQIGKHIFLGFPALRGISTKNPEKPSAETNRNRPEGEDILPLLADSGDARVDDIKQWLFDRQVRATAREHVGSPAAAADRKLINGIFSLLQDLMPSICLKFAGLHEDTLELLVETNDGRVPLDFVSQGTSSIINWVGFLLKRIYEIRGLDIRPKDEGAVVLVDEIDGHMHPYWQLRLLPLLRVNFPKMQFIATTHSPLVVCNVEDGVVYRFDRDEAQKSLVARRQHERPAGLGAEGLLTSDFFGLATQLDDETQELLDTKVALVTKNGPLTKKEQTKLRTLNKKLDALGLLSTFSDPYYAAFLQALARRQKIEEITNHSHTKQESERRLALIDEIFAELKIAS